MSSRQTSLALLLLFAYANTAAASCGSTAPLALCCMNVAPWSTNSGVWGGICGFTPSNPSSLVGARCIPQSAGGCPLGTVGTCCSGFIAGQCALGVYCQSSSGTSSTTTTSTTTTPTPTPTPPPSLPNGWSLASACSQDDGSRVLFSDVTTVMNDNTPNTCIAHCAASGYGFAGVENGNECHCGAGFVNGATTPIDPSLCGTPCTGDASQTCGGAWTIQLYQGPSPTETLPEGWGVLQPCASDTPSRVIVDDQLYDLDDNTPATCAELCDAAGFTYAGVEHGNECHCGTGFVSAGSAPTTDCYFSCSGSPGLTCGGAWRIQVYSVGS